MKSRILFVSCGRLLAELINSRIQPAVATRQFEKTFVFATSNGPVYEDVTYINIPPFLRRLKKNSPLKTLRLFCEFFQLLRYALKYKPLVIWGIYTLPYGLYSVIAARFSGSRSIVSVIGGTVEIETYYRLGALFKRLNLWQLRKADIVTVMGSKVLSYLLDHGIQREKLVIYPGAIDVSLFKHTEKEKSTDVLFVGTLRRLKGPDRVLQAVQELKQDFPDISCKIVGRGYLKDSLAQYVAVNHLENNVEILGFVDSTIPYFQDAKIAMIPSRSEGLPMVMLEAMSCGVVPVVSNVGSVTDVAVHGFNAMIVEDYLDIRAYYRCAKELLANPDKLGEMRANAIRTVKENYSVQAQSEIFGRIIGKLI